jgi:hypothetical protein
MRTKDGRSWLYSLHWLMSCSVMVCSYE